MTPSVDSVKAPLLSSTSLGRTLPRAVCVVAACLVCWPAFAHAIGVWSTTEEFGFGFLVPPVSIFLLWLRRSELRRSVRAGADAGLIVVVCALLVYVLAHRVEINAVAGLAIVPLLLGCVIYLWGWRAAGVLGFPIGFLGFGLGLFRGLLDTVGFAMQGLTATGAGLVTQMAGLGIAREGLVLRTNDFSFVVAEPCSGMSSLVSLLALAALWTHLSQGKLPARIVILASVLPIVLLANTIRVSLVLLIASTHGQEAALGYFHGASSLVLFGLALAGLLFISRVVGCKAPRFAI
jgi:exosortase